VRELTSAAIFSVGSELTTGETRDTNAGELAAELTRSSIPVERLLALPDDQAALRDGLLAALSRVDLVVTTGGLGPTPDDLTREAIAEALGETPAVDPDLERWLRGLFTRRGVEFPEANLKQAWLIPSAVAIPNEQGTAPGWWVDRPDGRVLVALPGPPREMRPMWADWVMPRLTAALPAPAAVMTLRTTGIGESLLAAKLGPLLARDADPTVATYARTDAVDVRISSRQPGPAGAASVASIEGEVLERIGEFVWSRGTTTWAQAIASELDARGWRLGIVEVGLRGSLIALLGEGLGSRMPFAEAIAERPGSHEGHRGGPDELAARVRELSASEVALAVEARARRGDTAVSVAVVDPRGTIRERRVAFLGDDQGRSRAALAAAAILLARLRAA
jgi:nicotinamide-nucleotide amidase